MTNKRKKTPFDDYFEDVERICKLKQAEQQKIASGGGYKDAVWYDAKRKNQSRREAWQKRIYEDVRLWDAFKLYPNLVDAVVLGKKDTRGSRFGFIRLANIARSRDWILELSKTSIDGAKLGVNLARFSKFGNRTGEQFRAKREKEAGNRSSKKHQEPVVNRDYRGQLNFLSYLHESWSKWFVSVVSWTGQELEIQRIAWLSILGVPSNMWSCDTFNDIGKHFGRVVRMSEASWLNSDLTMETIGVLVFHGNRVNEDIKLKFGNKEQVIWVREIDAVWKPPFLMSCQEDSDEDEWSEEDNSEDKRSR
ncbi:putative RNA-binding domain superfamily [Helianthus anomalus]